MISGMENEEESGLQLGGDSLKDLKLWRVSWLEFLNYLPLFRLHLFGFWGTIDASCCRHAGSAHRGRSISGTRTAPPCVVMARGSCI